MHTRTRLAYTSGMTRPPPDAAVADGSATLETGVGVTVAWVKPRPGARLSLKALAGAWRRGGD